MTHGGFAACLTTIVPHDTVHSSRKEGTDPMAHFPNTALPLARLSADGKWLKCPACSNAYWGAFRPTDFITAKLAAHTERKHKAQVAEAGDEPAADLPAKKARPAARARNAAKVAKIAAKAAARGDGQVRIVRTSELNLIANDIVDEIAQALELDPRLQLAQGPRNFSDEGNNRFEGPRRAKDANKGQNVVARVQAQLSPIKGWA
jgi:hypothetical protein